MGHARVDGRRRPGELLAGGEAIVLEADSWVELTLGNRAAVDLLVNGRPFSLPASPGNVVRGQYRNYADEHGVEAGSDVETYLAVRFEIDSWRWAGVHWLVRAGKQMGVTTTEAVITFRAPPHLLFTPPGSAEPGPNLMRFILGKDAGVRLHLHAKRPGEDLTTEPVDLRVDYAEALGPQEEPYQRLLDDAMDGDARRFGREDALDQQWRIVENVLGLARREAARPEHVDLGEFVRSFVAEYQESHPLDNDRLEAHLPRSPVATLKETAPLAARYAPELLSTLFPAAAT